MEIKGILFDKDGTLIDFFEVWGKGIRPAIEALLAEFHLKEEPYLLERILQEIGVKENQIDPEGSLAWKTYEMIAYDIHKTIQEQTKTDIEQSFIKAHLIQFFMEYQKNEKISLPVLADIYELMQSLHEMGLKLGIATTDEYACVKATMEAVNADQFISFYGAAGMSLPLKPDKELLFLAAKQWQIKPEEIAVVGDTPNDMRFAKNAGAHAIGVLSGTGMRKDLQEDADFIIPSVKELSKQLLHYR